MKIIFRTDASPTIGSGHVMRCMTLADYLTDTGHSCVFLCTDETPECVPALKNSSYAVLKIDQMPDHADILIVDHYGLDKTYETPARAWADKIVVIDDLADRHHDCDLLLDQTFQRDAEDYRSLTPEHCEILTGAKYALLRPQFAAMREIALKKRKKTHSKNILISLGSTNLHGITSKVLNTFKTHQTNQYAINVILGSKAPGLDEVRSAIDDLNKSGVIAALHLDVKDMADHMLNADIAIGAGGTTSWERCCLGLPTILIELADNQKPTAKALAESGAIINLGWYEDLKGNDILTALENLQKPEIYTQMSQAAAQICDGQGTQRLAEHIEKLGIATLHPMTDQDADLLFEWQTHDATRKHFRNPKKPDYAEHMAWVKSRLSDHNHHLFIAERNGNPCGFLRLEQLEGDSANTYEISLLVAPDHYRKGIGKQMLDALHTLKQGAIFRAEISENNKASLSLFKNMGYKETASNIYEYKND